MPKTDAPASRLSLPCVTLAPRGIARLKAGHPWVYRSDIASAEGVASGAMVRVEDHRGKSFGTALYSSSSQIAVRMIADDKVEIADLPVLVAERIRAAIAYRKQFVANTDAYRLVFSEADFLPGLIIDRYNDVVSIQILTQAMDAEPVRGAVVETLVEELKPAGVVERVDARIRDLEQLPARDSGLLWGKKSSTIISMNADESAERKTGKGKSERDAGAVRFHYDALEGQKTGAFLDQRENYAAAAQYAHGKALDVFCYQGGFALHLAPKCSSVTGVDSSRPALEMADRNAALNGQLLNGKEIEWIEGNAFDLLRDYAGHGRESGHRYDTVVLDPPAFAKTKRDLDKARSGYKELNLRALKMLGPGGVLVTCSCSFHVSAADFLEVVADAARDAHKSLRLLESRTQAKDHPILPNVPETSYLKCMIFYVSN
ncbi:MAG: class I SAM-dependent rRNA methyltransferase [Terriglobales bacterium]|jgi:23S rRNA (cytosine1962-C5)-methyltransferase